VIGIMKARHEMTPMTFKKMKSSSGPTKSPNGSTKSPSASTHTDDSKNPSKTDSHTEMMEKMMKINNDVIELVRNMEEKQRYLAEKVYDELTNFKQEKKDLREIYDLRDDGKKEHMELKKMLQVQETRIREAIVK